MEIDKLIVDAYKTTQPKLVALIKEFIDKGGKVSDISHLAKTTVGINTTTYPACVSMAKYFKRTKSTQQNGK